MNCLALGAMDIMAALPRFTAYDAWLRQPPREMALYKKCTTEAPGASGV